MSLRILFADDSMTAQNMGKKILSEAGYDVVAVSNGAAAVKKIAEQKPDIIILDVYMPGYSGLEVCEKVRGSLDTLKTPVLLTVGKMEPYKPEDANRVKADGVIIKPFEASDLLAIVKKFEERIGNTPPPPLAKPAAAIERFQEEAAIAPAEMPVEPRSTASRGSMQPWVEVPDHMAGSAAFGDMLGSEPVSPASHFAVNSPSAAFETSVIVPAPPVPVADDEPVAVAAPQEISAAAKEEEHQASPAMEAHTGDTQAIEIQTMETQAVETPAIETQAVETPIEAVPVPPSPEALTPELDAAPEALVTPVEAAPEYTAPEPVAVVEPETAVEPPHPQFIPVFKEPEPPATEYAFEPTAMPRVDDVEIQREPALQETAEETTRSTRADLVEPGLITTIGQEMEPSAPPVSTAAASPPVSLNAAKSFSVSQPAAAAAAEVNDADFEARVAAAMAAYNQASEAETPAPPAIEQHAPNVVEHSSLAETDIYDVPVDETLPAAPSFEYHPPVREEAQAAVEIAPEHVSAEESGAAETAVAAGMETAIPEAAAAAAADTGADHHTIAQAVHRVTERLKAELIEEIMKELKLKK